MTATLDLDATATRLNRRDAAKRGWIARQAKAAARKADALVAEMLLQAQADAEQAEHDERLAQDAQDALEALASEQHTPTRRLRSTYCLCCTGPTRGGQFLPGHDARYASILISAYRQQRTFNQAAAWREVFTLADEVRPAFLRKMTRAMSAVEAKAIAAGA